MIDISDISLVESICEMGSLTKAADKLHISQPTLTKRLARLENQLSAILFHRGSKGLTPTPIALYLIESASPMKSQIASIERHVERILMHDQGELRIGVGPIIEQVLLPDVLIRLRQHTGNVRVSVLTEHATVLIDQLKSGRLDVIAGPFGTEAGTLQEDGIQSIDLIQEQTINVVRNEHPILKKKRPNFFGYPYASPPVQGTMETSVERISDRPRLVSDNYTLLKKVALETDYICGGPREVFRTELDSGSLKEVRGLPAAEWRSACLFKTEAKETPLVKLFLETLQFCRDAYVNRSLVNETSRGEF